MISTIQMDVKISRLWILYFLTTITVVGFLLAYGLCIPFYIVGRLYKPSERLADLILQKGIALLMALQPWYKNEINITLPQKSKSEGLLIISNHRSTLDVFILLSKIQGIRVFAKSALFFIPFLNVMMLATKQIYAPRNKLDAFFRALQNVRKRLRSGETVHIFPEMTRCSKGFDGIQNFSLAPFALAIEEKTLILPVVFKDTDQVWPKGQFRLFAGNTIKVKSLETIEARHFTSADDLRMEVQSKILTTLRDL